jgi:hypothetical protein
MFDFAEQDANRYRNVVGMGGAPRNDLLDFEGVVGDGADGDYVLFNLCGISHAGFSMAHSLPTFVLSGEVEWRRVRPALFGYYHGHEQSRD